MIFSGRKATGSVEEGPTPRVRCVDNRIRRGLQPLSGGDRRGAPNLPMTPNIYAILSRCVADGIHQGIIDNNKHREKFQPIDERAREQIHSAIMRELSEYFDWEDSDK